MSEQLEPPHVERGRTLEILLTKWKNLSPAEKLLWGSSLLTVGSIEFFVHFLYDSIKEYWTLVPFWVFILTCVGLLLNFIVSALVLNALGKLRTDSLEAMTQLRKESIEFRKSIAAEVGHYELGLRQEIIEYLNWQPELNIEGVDMPEELAEGRTYPVWLTPHLIPHLFFSEDRGTATRPYEHLECTVQITLQDGINNGPFTIEVRPASMSLAVKGIKDRRFDLTVGVLHPRHFGYYNPAQRKRFSLSLTLQITENLPNRTLVKAGSTIQRLLRTVYVTLQNAQDLLHDLCRNGYVKRIPAKTDSDPIFTLSPHYPYYASNLHLVCMPQDGELRDRLVRMAARRVAVFLQETWLSGAFELEAYKAAPQSNDAGLNSEEAIKTLCDAMRALVPTDGSSQQTQRRQRILIALHETQDAIRFCDQQDVTLFSLIGRDEPKGSPPTLCLFDLSSRSHDELPFPAYVASFSSLSEEALKLAARSDLLQISVADAGDPSANAPPVDRSPVLSVRVDLLKNPSQLATELGTLAASLSGKDAKDFIIRPEGCFLNASAELSDTWVSLPKVAQKLFSSQGLLDAFLRWMIRAYRAKNCEIFNLCVHDTVLGDKRLARVFQDRGAGASADELPMIGLGFDNDHAPSPKHVPQPSQSADCICVITALDHDLASYAKAFEKIFDAAGNRRDLTAILVPMMSTRFTRYLPFNAGGSKRFADVVPIFVAHKESLASSLHAVEYVGSPIQVALKQQDAGNVEGTA